MVVKFINVKSTGDRLRFQLGSSPYRFREHFRLATLEPVTKCINAFSEHRAVRMAQSLQL